MKRCVSPLVYALAGAAILAGQATYNPAAPWRSPDGTVVSSYWLYSNKMHYAGTYSAAVTYGAQDLVIYAGTSYVSLQAANIAHTPSTSATWWTIMGGSVTSVFGRAGAVVATSGDYTAAQVGAEPAITAGTSAQYWRGDKSWATFPTTFAPAAHASTHATGQGDALSGTLDVSISGNAATATALGADPADCTNQFARGIAASGAAACASVAGADFATQTANYVLAGPGSGSAAAPGFRALVTADIPSAAYLPTCTKYAVTTSGGNWTVNAVTNDALAASVTQTITIGTNAIPAGGEITSLRIKHSTAFAGTGITAMVVTLGDGTTTNIYAPDWNVFQAVANTTLWTDGSAGSTTSAQHSVTTTFTSTGGNLSAISAGAVDIWVCVRTLP